MVDQYLIKFDLLYKRYKIKLVFIKAMGSFNE